MRNLDTAESQHSCLCKPFAGSRGHPWCVGPRMHAAFQLQRQQAARVLATLTSSVGAQSGLLLLPLLLLLLPLLLVVAVVLLLILLRLSPGFPRNLDLCLIQQKNHLWFLLDRKHLAFSLGDVYVTLRYNLFISLAKSTY